MNPPTVQHSHVLAGIWYVKLLLYEIHVKVLHVCIHISILFDEYSKHMLQ